VNGTDVHTVICGVNSSNDFDVRTVSGGWSQYSPSGLGFTPSTAPGSVACGNVEVPDGVNAEPMLSMEIIDTSHLIHISHDGVNWHTVVGPSGAAFVASPTSDQVVLVANSGRSYHYTGMMPAVTQTTSGTYTCPGCTGSSVNHLATANATFPHGLAGGQQQESALWNSNFNVTSIKDYDPSCDPIFTFGNPECNIALTSTVDCPIAGYLPVTYQTTEPMESGYTFQKYSVVIFTGKSVELRGVDLVYVQLTVVPWCTNTPYPVVNYIWVDEDDDAYYYYVIAHWRGYPGNWNVTWTINTGTSNTIRFGGCTSLPKAN
jgi:hypothetical protein